MALPSPLVAHRRLWLRRFAGPGADAAWAGTAADRPPRPAECVHRQRSLGRSHECTCPPGSQRPKSPGESGQEPHGCSILVAHPRTVHTPRRPLHIVPGTIHRRPAACPRSDGPSSTPRQHENRNILRSANATHHYILCFGLDCASPSEYRLRVAPSDKSRLSRDAHRPHISGSPTPWTRTNRSGLVRTSQLPRRACTGPRGYGGG